MNTPDNLVYEFGPFLLEPHARRLSRNGESLPLAAPEFELLLLLVRNHGRVVEKSEIMDAVWPDAVVEENNLTVRMSALRRALGEKKGYHPYIQTVTGRGYCLITHVRELPAQAATNGNSAIENNGAGELPVPTESAVAERSWFSLHGLRQIRGFKLYALLLVPLLGASALYGTLRWHRWGPSQASAQPMKMSRVTHSGRIWAVAVSPDGQTIAYVEREGELNSLWLQRVGTSNPLQLRPPAKLRYSDPAFSRDGNTLYYSKCQPSCTLHKMPVFGGVETDLHIRADCPVTFSPDGGRMAYMRLGAVPEKGVVVSVIIAHSDGTNVQEIYTRPAGLLYQYGAIAWSPDGKMIAVPFVAVDEGRRFHKVVGIGVADGSETTLTSRWSSVHDVTWLPDSSALIINARDQASYPDFAIQIWYVPLTGGEPRRITNDLNTYFNIALSTDGKTLIAQQTQRTSGLWIGPSEDPSAAAPVTRGTLDRRDGDLGLAVMPDDRLIYVSELSGKTDLWSVNADGSGPKQLTDGSHSHTYPAATPDGRYVVFESSREGTHNIWRMDADGKNQIRLTRGRYEAEPVCSPDGKWVVYMSHPGVGEPLKLWKVSIEGGEPILLTDEYAQHPTFSPDGKFIAYHHMDKERKRWVVVIPSKGGARIKAMPIPKNFGWVMRWAPDGDSISYLDNTQSSLWKMPLDGTPPSQIIELDGESMITFRYSPDGRRLAYTRGINLSDVIVITGFK